MTIKKLIEVALPLEAINAAAAYEKMPGIGPHPRGLHQWWARRPLAAARAIIWSSLVDDPSSHPELFPTEEQQNKERKRLFSILEQLVIWKNSNNVELLKKAKNEILKYNNGKFPMLLDPFAGGGAIPLEAQRLGLEAHAHDLNPVAVMINKSMIEIPPKFADLPPINPKSNPLKTNVYKGSSGLAEDVKYYGNLLKEKAFEKIGHLYPKVEIPKEQGGGEATVVAWIWVRTIKCPNPACACYMPLASSFILSKKKGREAWIEPHLNNNEFYYEVHYGKCPNGKESAKLARGGSFRCAACGAVTDTKYVHEEFENKKNRVQLMAIVAEGNKSKLYLSPDNYHISIANVDKLEDILSEDMNVNSPDLVSGRGYGVKKWNEIFSNRQLLALNTFCECLPEIRKIIENDATLNKRFPFDDKSLASNGVGIKAYAEAISVYLSFAIDRTADFSTSVSRWSVSNEKAMNCFSKQAIPMTWDYPEVNVFGNAVGSFDTIINYISDCIKQLPIGTSMGIVKQVDAKKELTINNLMISTDPPYYDNIAYADLSDFFYVWLRRNLNDIYPEVFNTILTPKSDELVANSYRFNGNYCEAKSFFENGMFSVCKQLYKYSCDSIPVTIYYAFKQSETESAGNDEVTSSSGWETMLSAIIKAGFAITGTWPIRTEQSERSISMNTNALASSIVLVCRKRQENAPVCSRRNFLMELKKELKTALKNMQNSELAPVDLAQSAIGPGIGIFSKYSKVLEADGKPMSVRSALQIINNEIDFYFNGQDEDLDKESRFCVDLYTQYGFDNLKYGDAETLSKAKNASIVSLTENGILFAEKGVVHLVDRSELKWPKDYDVSKTGIWLWAQLLTKELSENGIDGAAKLVGFIGNNETAEKAKALVYRLYTIAEHKNWSKEAYSYNSLVISWSQILASSTDKVIKQQTLQF